MGDRGGTATDTVGCLMIRLLYPMGDRGGTATHCTTGAEESVLYPMGDRGGTATILPVSFGQANYTRWEIGGEPQRARGDRARLPIIPDGRSGGNRNTNRMLVRVR